MQKPVVLLGVVVLAGLGMAAYLLTRPTGTASAPARPVAQETAKPSAEPEAPGASEVDSATPSRASNASDDSEPKISEDDAMADSSEGNEDEFETREIKVYGTVTDAATSKPVAGAEIITAAYLEMESKPGLYQLAEMEGVNAAEMTEEDLNSLLKEGGPLAEAIRRSRGEETVKSDADGAFTMTMFAYPEDAVHCRAKGYAMASRTIEEDSPDSVRIDFQLSKGGTISGRVTNAANGQPVEDVKVGAMAGDAASPFAMYEEEMYFHGVTGPDGAYTIEGLPHGHRAVIVMDEVHGWLFDPARTVNVTLAEGEAKTGVDLVVSEGLRAEGTVTNEDGQPVEGAAVSAEPKVDDFLAMSGPIGSPAPAVTDEKGSYVALGLRPGVTTLAVSHEDYAGASADVTVEAGKAAPRQDFKLVRGVEISGIAKYPDGSPAEQEILYLVDTKAQERSGPFDYAGGGTEHAFTEEETGEFRIEHVAAGDYELRTTPSYRDFAGDEEPKDLGPKIAVHVDGKTPVTGLEITVPKNDQAPELAKAITGTVLDREGKPAANVGVRAVSEDDESMPFVNSFVPDETTDKEGTFRLEYLYGSEFTVEAGSDDGEASQANVKPGDNITLRLGPVTSVSGTVVDANGDAVARCAVSLTKPKEDKPVTMASMMEQMFGSYMDGEGETTDDFGQFTFMHVQAGDYVVEAKSPGKGFGASAKFSVTKGTEKQGVQVKLDTGAAFAGVVVDGSGAPVPGTNVSLVESTGGPKDNAMMMGLPLGMGPSPGAVATSGADGTFTLTGLKPGTYMLSAKHADYAPFTGKDIEVQSQQSAPYQVTLGRGGSARGQYLADGKPKANVAIQLMGEGGMQMAMTDSEGRFEVKGLAAGTYMVMPMDFESMAGSAEDDMLGMHFKSVTITEGGDVVIPFGGGVAITGTVPEEHRGKMTIVYLMRKGAPDLPSLVGGMDPMEMMDSGMQLIQYMAGMAPVNDDGTFNLGGVDPGEYEVRVFSSDMDFGDIDPDEYLNTPIEEMQQRSQEFAPKEVLRHPVTVTDKPIAIEFPAASEAAP